MFQHPWEYLTDLNSVKVESNDTALIHQGKGFAHYNQHSVANGATLDHLWITPSDKEIHLREWSVKSSVGPVSIIAYEDTTVSNNGTVEAVGCLSRIQNITSKLQLYHTPTVTGVGNQLLQDFIGPTGGGAHVTVGSAASNPLEWVLKKNSKYMLRVTNNSGSTADVVIFFYWYEI